MAREDFFRGVPTVAATQIEPLALAQYKLREAIRAFKTRYQLPDAAALRAAITTGSHPYATAWPDLVAWLTLEQRAAQARTALEGAVVGVEAAAQQDPLEEYAQRAAQAWSAVFSTLTRHLDALTLHTAFGDTYLLRYADADLWWLEWLHGDVLRQLGPDPVQGGWRYFVAGTAQPVAPSAAHAGELHDLLLSLAYEPLLLDHANWQALTYPRK